jgi:uncharacterized membrane protein YkgB
MDEFVRNGVMMLTAAAVAVLVILVMIAFLIFRLLQAFATGDRGFLVSCGAGLLLVIVLYAGTGLWLRKTGRI